MNMIIREVEGQDMFDALYALTNYAFHSSPPFENKEEWLEHVRGRKGITCHAIFEGDTAVSVAASTVMTQNVRGELFSASGIWGVATHPAARRKGYVRQIMASLLAAERESGKVFSNLYPFRETFYERLGYVTYPYIKIAKFNSAVLEPLLKANLEGEIDLKLIGEAYQTYREYLANMRQNRHGMAIFDYGDQTAANRNLLWTSLARFDGEIEGLMLYSLEGEHVGKFNFHASRFYYKTSRARYLLLSWIARHIDQAGSAELWLPGDETPETWLSDIQVTIESPARAPMGRVLDVAKISGMQVGEGSFTAKINDPLCPWNEGPWRFDACDGRLVVSPSSAAVCELTIQGLSALVAGTHDPEDFALRGWGNPDPALQATLRKMFPRMTPYLHEMF
jgi:predicted acetyltransferase